MTTETSRSHHPAFIVGVIGVPFAVGLALAVWGRPVGDIVPRIAGALGIVGGVFLLTLRNLFKPDPGEPTAPQVRARHMARRGIRIGGAGGILFGVAQFFPDIHVRTALMVCAAVVSMAGVFKVPRRFFILEERAD